MNPAGELRYRRWWLAVGYALVVLVVYLSLTPKPIQAPEVGEVKLGHFAAYAVLMLWFAQVFASLKARLAIAVGLVVMGVCLELAQGLTGYRTFAYDDMLDNAIGVAVGLALAATPLGRALLRVEAWLAYAGANK